MTNSFGGFSGNPDIENFLISIETDFVNMVISHSVVLKDYQRKSNEVLEIAKRQVYPRIGLRLSSAKDKDNTPLFASTPFSQSQLASDGYDTVRTGLYENVLRLITDETSPLSQGITNVAASLTAAILIRSIPINNDIKNIDLGNEIEKRAFEDLDRIVEIFKLDTPTNIPVDLPGAGLSKQSIYISLDIDKTTLPATWFNVNPVDERIIIENTQPNSNVRPLDYLSIPSDKVAFGWYFVSGTEFESIVPNPDNTNGTTTALTIYPPKEGAFLVKDGYGADDIISILSDYLNEAGLERDTNVIASPNSGELTLGYVTLSKKKLYPDEVNKIFDRKVVSFRMQQRVNSLTFDARRVSSVVSRELIILRFFTLDKVVLAQKKVESTVDFNNIFISYTGAWDSITSYAQGEIVDLNSNSYLAKLSSTGANPLGDLINWIPLYSDAEDLIPFKVAAQDYIEGLLYGLNKSYSYLDKKGPKSVLLAVENGNLKVINPNSTSSNPTNNYVIDTFYFRLAEGIFSVTGTLKIRVASTKLIDVPEIFSFLNPVDQTLDIVLENASAEEAAVEVLKAIHLISQYTDVLSALVYPYALQFTAFKRTKEEVKEVIDILQVPSGLEIATGSSGLEKTPYRSKPRSLIVEATLIPSSLRRYTPIDSSGKRGEVQKVLLAEDKSLQAVKDKLNFLYQPRIGGYY